MISKNILKVNSEINSICKKAGRDPSKITVLGASKSQSIEKIREAYISGINHFGENYLQEAESKIDSIGGDVTWHFIGSIQSRKAKKIAEIFDWAHAVDSVKIAKKLNDARPLYKNALKVCIQLNIDKEASKSGIELKDIENIFFEIRGFENLEIKGLMVIPRPRDSIQEQQNVFKEVKEIFDSLNQKGMNMDTLSMGMSSDYGIAIKEGSTMIRIGTGIFGQRK